LTIEAKHAASVGAGAANDAAAVLAGGAAVCGGLAVVTGGVGGLCAAGFALLSAGAWLVGNEYGDLALDPPRSDYDIVTVYRAPPYTPLSYDRSHPPLSRFIRLQAQIGGAIAALVTSMERLDGARIDLRAGTSEPDQLVRQMSKQRGAIAKNANLARRGIKQALAMRETMNATWRDHLASLEKQGTKLNDRQEAEDLWAGISTTLLQLDYTEEKIAAIKDRFLGSVSTEVSIDDEVFGDDWWNSMLKLQERLSVLAGERRQPPKAHELDGIGHMRS